MFDSMTASAPGNADVVVRSGYRSREPLEDVGVNHVVLNLKYGSRPAEVVLTDLERHVLEAFPPVAQTSVTPR